MDRSVHNHPSFYPQNGTGFLFFALGTQLKSRSRTVRQTRKAKTRTTHHVLMELAIAALNARLLAGIDDVFQRTRRRHAAGLITDVRARARQVEGFGRCHVKPSGSIRLEREERMAMRCPKCGADNREVRK